MKDNQTQFLSGTPFGAYHAACEYLSKHGYSYGSSSAMHPTAILKGDIVIAKWKNLTPDERKAIDGKMEGDFRQGPVTITFYDGFKPEPDYTPTLAE